MHSPSRVLRSVLIASVVALMASSLVVVTGGGTARASGTPGVNDYPYQGATDCSGTYGIYAWCIGGSYLSPLGFAYRNCTDFVAWRAGITWGSFIRGGDGHARGWKAAALTDGYTVSTTPVPGSIAWWGGTNSNPYGHVAYVTSVNSNGTANIEQYNYAGTGVYSQSSGITADAYLYVNVSGGGAGHPLEHIR